MIEKEFRVWNIEPLFKKRSLLKEVQVVRYGNVVYIPKEIKSIKENKLEENTKEAYLF